MYCNWKKNINTNELYEVCNLIKNGDIVIFPTETVYGIGANALDENAVNKIFKAKGRPSDNPLIVHLADKNQISSYAKNITKVEQKLIDVFMPGPFTIILERKENIPLNVTAGLNSVAIRIPSSEIAHKILETAGVPIAAPSANISGKPSGTCVEDIREELENRVSAIVDGGNTLIGLESTVVKVIDEIPVILRPGKITPDEIKEVVSNVRIDNNVFEKVDVNKKVESPGMKYKHYSPDTKCKLIYSKDDGIQIELLNEICKQYNYDVAILGFEEHKTAFNAPMCEFISLGKKNEINLMAQNIYSALRMADKLNKKIILIEGIAKEGLGIAIMNRLLRTCGYDYIER